MTEPKYIDAKEFWVRLISVSENDWVGFDTIDEILSEMSAADVQEVKHGRWIETTVPELWECSVCGCVIYSETEIDRKIYHKWCGRCGAKMDGDAE